MRSWLTNRAVVFLVGLLGLFALLLVVGFVVGPSYLKTSANESITQKRWSSAATHLEHYLLLRPNDHESRILLATSLLGMGNQQAGDALLQLERVPDTDLRAAEARSKSGDILLNRLRKAEAADRMFRRALELDPDLIEARLGLFQIYWWEQRKIPESLEWMEEVYRRGSPQQRLTALTKRFWFYYAEFPAYQAMPMMRTFLHEDPTDFGARVGLARCLFEESKYEEGAVLLRQCLSERPADISARSLLSGHLVQRGDWTELRSVLDEWPMDDRELIYWEYQGLYLDQAAGDSRGALEAFEKVLASRPDRWSVRFRLSRCLEELGQRERAKQEQEISNRIGRALLNTRVRRLLEEVLPHIQARPEGCREVGRLLSEIGLAKEAERWFQMEEEIRPDGAAKHV